MERSCDFPQVTPGDSWNVNLYSLCDYKAQARPSPSQYKISPLASTMGGTTSHNWRFYLTLTLSPFLSPAPPPTKIF